MAFPNWTITAYLLFIVLVNMWTRAADGVLILKPKDVHLLAGQVATLNCSTSSTEGVHWYHGTSYIYAGGKLYSPYNYRLKVEVYQIDGTAAFNLVFPSAKPEDAGTYSCIDIQGRGEKGSAEMTVLTADVNGSCQSNMKPDGVVIQNDCNIDPDAVQLSCSVTFYGKNPPQLEWRKVPEDGDNVANTECQTINNRITCNASAIGDRQMNGSSYVCRAAGSTQWNISVCSIPVKNLIYAFDGKTTTNPSVGQEVQCNSETSQSCNYKWKYSDTVISTNRAITTDRTGLYQCEADCNIRGKRCIVFGYVYVSNEDSTSCSTGCVFGICMGILSLILGIIILIIVKRRFLLKKDKGEGLQLPNTCMSPNEGVTSAENGTQQEQIGLMQPHEEFRTQMDTHDKETQTELFGTNQDLAATILDETTLVQTLIPNAASKQDKAVFGIAILGDELFASSHECPEIEVFGDLQKLERRRTFLLTGYQLENPWDLQSSSMYHCLYIVDVKRNEDDNTKIIKIDREGIAEKEWKTDCKAGRLSVTKESNVIITSLYTLKIEEYSYDGVLNRLIELRTDAGIANPWVTLKRNENEYIISHGNRGNARHGVCLINQKGSIKQSFGEKKGSANGQLFVPVHMAAYSDGHILVADKDNSRVVVLSPDFKFITTLFSRDEYLRFPNRLCLDEQNKRLFVSDNQWFSNMKPWINGKILVFDVSKVQASLNSALEKN